MVRSCGDPAPVRASQAARSTARDPQAHAVASAGTSLLTASSTAWTNSSPFTPTDCFCGARHCDFGYRDRDLARRAARWRDRPRPARGVRPDRDVGRPRRDRSTPASGAGGVPDPRRSRRAEPHLRCRRARDFACGSADLSSSRRTARQDLRAAARGTWSTTRTLGDQTTSTPRTSCSCSAPEPCALGAASLTSVESGARDPGLLSGSRPWATRSRSWAAYTPDGRAGPHHAKLQITHAAGASGRSVDSARASRRHLMLIQHPCRSRSCSSRCTTTMATWSGSPTSRGREYRLLGEFDGMIKYGRLLKDGRVPERRVSRTRRIARTGSVRSPAG